MRKAFEQPVNQFNQPSPVSPDGRWVYAWAPLPNNGPAAGQVFSLDGKAAITLGGSGLVSWAAGGALLTVFRAPEVFFFSLAPGQILPNVPAGGFRSTEEIARLPGARRIEGQMVTLGPSPDMYAYYKGSTQRNLYRIPVP